MKQNNEVDEATRAAAHKQHLREARQLLIEAGYRETFPGSGKWVSIEKPALDQIDNTGGGPDTPETN